MTPDPADPRAGGDRGDGADDSPFSATSMPLVPDDARELARDIEAWRREVRWEQRKRRIERWTSIGGGRGQLPGGTVVAALLVIGLIGAMLVVFTPRDVRHQVPAVRLALAAPAVAPGQVGGLLPDADLTTSDGTVVAARDLRPAVIALVPANCDCAAALRTLVTQTEAADLLPVEMVSTASQAQQLATLTTDVGAGLVVGLRDIQSTLVDAVAPQGLDGLSVVAVHSDGVIGAFVPGFDAQSSVERQIAHLAQPGFDQIVAGRASP